MELRKREGENVGVARLSGFLYWSNEEKPLGRVKKNQSKSLILNPDIERFRGFLWIASDVFKDILQDAQIGIESRHVLSKWLLTQWNNGCMDDMDNL